ncbi:MAG: glycoside hydrolase family 172 protein [Planctomycetota bacterium]|nr:glycoside hydrolase family 172 protein [Planctomycetota bacterium]
MIATLKDGGRQGMRRIALRATTAAHLAWAVIGLLCLPPDQSAGAGALDELARPHEGRSMRATSAHRSGPDGKYDPNAALDPDSNWDNQNVPAGETKILMEEDGPGVITHIWTTFLGPEPHAWAKNGSANHQEMLLRIFYDGSDRPGVEAPVGDFFANCFGRRREVISLPVVVEDGDSYNCFWHMPFRESIRVEIVNQSDKPISLLYYNIDWIKRDSLPADTPYFYAQYRQEYPVRQGSDYVILETEGRGHYVGTVLAVRTRSPAWFGEGDEKIYIDGEETASIWGTGTEDYFLSAWGLKTTSTPYFGTPYFDQWGIVGGHTSAYRWHINDPIVFNTGIRVTIEHYGWISPDENAEYKTHSWNEREDDYASVAFWYQAGTPTFAARAPHARRRALPSLDRIIYAVDFVDDTSRGAGDARVQELLGYERGQVLYQPDDPDDAWIEIPFTVEEKAPKRLLLNMTRSYDFGRYVVTLNGVQLGGVLDFYHPDTENREYHLLDFWPEPGDYVLRLECVGKHPRSTGHWLGIESVRLRQRRPRVAEWAHEKDRDWREDPVLHR